MDIIAAVVDRSGSMGSIKGDAEGGLNAFLAEQKKLGNARLTLAEFDDKYDLIHNNMDINLFESYELKPRGMTALYDAIGKTAASVKDIKVTGQKIFVIVTDGAENSSVEWRDKSKIFEMITEMKNDGWEVMFIGADENAMREAKSLGVNDATAFTMDTNINGAANTMYSAVSTYASSLRRGLSRKEATIKLDNVIDASDGALSRTVITPNSNSGEEKESDN